MVRSTSDGAPMGRRTLALWTILAAQLMLQMDFLIVIVALPQIQQDLGFDPLALSWVPNAFGLAFGGLLLLGGRLGDILGQVRAFRTGLIIFVLASLLGGLAQTPTILVAARVVQGIGAALAGPSVLALVMVLARNDAERAKGMSLFIAVSSVGASAGLILGGLLTQFLSWRWSLLINVPVGAVVIFMIGRLVTETRPRRSRLDVVGAITATLGSVALVYGFISAAESGWLDVTTLSAFALALALFVLFFRTEKKHAAPLLHLDLLRDRGRVGALGVMALIVGMHFSVVFLLVQYLQQVLGWTPLFSGLAYLPLTATVFIISHFVPRLMNVFGAQALLVTGSLLVATSLVGFALLGDRSDYFPAVLVPLLIHAAGIGLVFAPGTVAIMHGVPEEHAGTASGLLQMDQQIGGALGIAVITSIYAFGAVPGQFGSGLPAAFIGAAVIALFAAILAMRTVSRRLQAQNSTAGIHPAS
ncbi:MFS transporter [Kaistia terrae]|uniref:MFS transporter n=1 Tax=Kaistia terrae TaxID=537017 RepID=A0ABW0PYI7_9HYPH|nr:MFS transporter [Kaistia terrae]MCX5580277.1 MFS transporter [Kaistia terrae]